MSLALESLDAARRGAGAGTDPKHSDTLRTSFRRELATRPYHGLSAPEGVDETTPGITAVKRLEQARAEIVEACDGFLAREAIRASLTADERREILQGMVLTRAVDNRLKQLFMGGEVRWGTRAFQGKGFRSLGQEAIYAGGIRLRRGADFQRTDGTWNGDVLAPVIRDLGITLAMRHDEEAVRQVLSAQMGKAGPPMFGKDLHTGDWAWGVLPAAAPLAVGSLSIAGLAMAFWREGSGRVALSFIGEGGSSLGEWHEAINLCAVRKLPAVFCLQNNQTALSTPVPENSAARVFADKAAGYGIPGVTIDGTDPDAVAAAFTWAADRARHGAGPALLELVSMRMCGHAHHDDMLYHGKEVQPSWDYPPLHGTGYANRDEYEFWSKRDPVARYAATLEADRIIKRGALDDMKRWAADLVERQAQVVVSAPWPEPREAGIGVFEGEPPRTRIEVLDPTWRRGQSAVADLPPLHPGLPFDKKGSTLLEAVMLGVGDALRADPRVFVYGEDVGGHYGNAFLLLRPLLEEFGDRI
ncbi:MAG: thiamine pyrophosphate-dependent enzyme, partial [Vicinamibacterales bacterium]